MKDSHSSWRDRLAAEYVLGTLHGSARRRFERLLPAHPALQRAVIDWERRLNRLAIASPAAIPPPEVWHRLQQRLFASQPRASWWNSLPFWRGLALTGVLLAVFALVPQWHVISPETDLAFAAIRGKSQEVLWTVALANDGRLHVSNLQAMAMPPDQRCFLWLKAEGSPPMMLGILPDDGSSLTWPMPVAVTEPMRSALWVTMQPMASKPPVPVEPLYRANWKAI